MIEKEINGIVTNNILDNKEDL